MRREQKTRKPPTKYDDTYLLIGELLAPSLFADLMALVVATGRTISAVVLPLAPDALPASLTLLLCLRIESVLITN